MSKLIDMIEKSLAKYGLVTLAEEPEVAEDEIGSVIVSSIIPAEIPISYSAIGAPVMMVGPDGVEVPVEDGEYLLKENKKGVIVDGKLSELIKIEEVADEVPAKDGETDTEGVEMKEEIKETKTEETKVELEETKEEVVEETKEPEVELSEDDLKMAVKLRSALSNINITKPGSYYISLEVDEDLNVTYGAMSSSTYESLVLAEEEKVEAKINELSLGFETKLSEQKEKYEAVIAAFKTGETKTKETPDIKKDVKLSRAEIIKMNIAEKKKNNN